MLEITIIESLSNLIAVRKQPLGKKDSHSNRCNEAIEGEKSIEACDLQFQNPFLLFLRLWVFSRLDLAKETFKNPTDLQGANSFWTDSSLLTYLLTLKQVLLYRDEKKDRRITLVLLPEGPSVHL